MRSAPTLPKRFARKTSCERALSTRLISARTSRDAGPQKHGDGAAGQALPEKHHARARKACLRGTTIDTNTLKRALLYPGEHVAAYKNFDSAMTYEVASRAVAKLLDKPDAVLRRARRPSCWTSQTKCGLCTERESGLRTPAAEVLPCPLMK